MYLTPDPAHHLIDDSVFKYDALCACFLLSRKKQFDYVTNCVYLVCE